MKLNTQISKTEISGAQSIGKFGMEMNAKAYQILTDGIYSNKIKAIIRELSTNAWDSHVEANNNNPFDVHLPHTGEEYFYIRDYGTGLSEQSILNVYTSFFTSTKDTSNQYNGILGIGSKVPYSYNTKTFTIDSYYHGTQYTYVCFIDDAGIPSYAKVSEVNTIEPNGVKIQFAVNTNDIYSFGDEASKLYKHFIIKPNFIGKSCDVSSYDKCYCHKNIFLDKNAENTPVAKMGNVAYPIEFDNDALKEFDYFDDTKIVIEFNIGDVDFSSSRESLAYTQKTILALRKVFKEYKDFLKGYFQKRLDECEDEFSASMEYDRLYEEILFGISDVNFLKLNPLYKGKPLLREMDLECDFFGRSYGKHIFSSTKKIRIGLPYKYIIMEKGCKTRIITYVKESYNIRGAYILNEEQASKINKKYLIYSSSLPKKERVQYNKTDYYILCSYGWIAKDGEIPKDAYYVWKEPSGKGGYADGTDGNKYYSASWLSDISNRLKINIIGFNRNQIKKSIGNKPLIEYIDNEKKSLLSKINALSNEYHYWKIYEHLTYFPGTTIPVYSIISKGVTSEYIDFYQKAKEGRDKFIKAKGSELLANCEFLGIPVEMNYDAFYKEYRKLEARSKISLVDVVADFIKRESYVSV